MPQLTAGVPCKAVRMLTHACSCMFILIAGGALLGDASSVFALSESEPDLATVGPGGTNPSPIRTENITDQFATVNTVTWIGGAGAWELAANWSPATVPVPASDVVINSAGIVTLSTPGVIVNSLTLGGTLTGGGSLSLSGNSAQTGGVLLVSRMTVANGATFTWLGGTMSGTGTTSVASGGTLVISSSCCGAPALVLDQRMLTNAGRVTWASASSGFTVQNGASINNQASGVFDIQSNAALLSPTTPATQFTNAGTLQKTSSQGTTTLQVALTNTGLVSVASGTLSLDTSSTTTGQFIVGGSGVLDFSAGSHAWNAGTTFGTGTGTVRLDGGTLTVNGDVTLPSNSVEAAGTLVGSGTLTVPSGATFTWFGGTMGGTGTTSVASGGTLVIWPSCCGAPALVLDQRGLTNAGRVTWASGGSGFSVQNGASINNQVSGVFDIQSNAELLSPTTPATQFTNAGTLQKTSGQGNSTLQVALINTGTVSISSGTLGIAVGLTQSPSGTLAFQLAGTTCTSPTRLDVTGGTANLGGSLTVATSTGCVPVPGQDFQLITFPLHTGDFTSVTSPYVWTYTATDMTVAVPQEVRLITPQRVVDTRSVGGPIPSGTVRCFLVAGISGIPADAGAVVLNVTAVGQTTNGWLTVYPDGQAVPATSTLNFGTSEYAMANGAIVGVGTGDQVCVSVGTVNSALGSSQVILDATGFLSSRALTKLAMLPAPVRLIDTRTVGGPIATGASRCFQVAGVGDIPVDATAVVLNVTAADYATNGWLTAFPNGQSVPATSTLNFDRSEYAMANGTIVRIGGAGQVCVNVGTAGSAPGGSNVILDAEGYMTATGLAQIPMLTSPQRMVDTRTSSGPIMSGTSRCFMIAGADGIPVGATGVVLNVTAVGYGNKGWLTAYPSGQTVPATSTLNFDVSEYAMANGMILRVGTGGKVCVNVGTVNSAPGSAQVILDVVGYLLG